MRLQPSSLADGKLPKIMDIDYQHDIATRIHELTTLAWEIRNSNPSRALELSLEAQALLRESPGEIEQIRCNATLAGIYAHRGEHLQALQLGHQALAQAEALPFKFLQPFILATLGITYWQLGNFSEALRLFQLQYRIAQEIGDTQNKIEALVMRAVISDVNNDRTYAEELYQQAITLFEREQDYRGQALALNNMAMCVLDNGHTVKALSLALQAIEMVQSIDYPALETACLATIGDIYLRQGNPPQALKYLHLALDIAEKNNFVRDKALLLLHLGQIYIQQRKWKSAYTNFHSALALFQKANEKVNISECHRMLSELYERQGKFAQALNHYKQFQQIKEQVYNEEAAEKLRNLQVMHEIETTKQEAEIHRLKNVELQAALEKVKLLSGLLPICASCKNIRDDQGYWHQIEVYIQKHSEADFSHSICPDCVHRLYPEYAIDI